MRQVTIYQGNRFALVSYGNGLSYALTSATDPSDNGVYVEGDDAATFRHELELLEDKHPHWHVDDILARMRDIYSP